MLICVRSLYLKIKHSLESKRMSFVYCSRLNAHYFTSGRSPLLCSVCTYDPSVFRSAVSTVIYIRLNLLFCVHVNLYNEHKVVHFLFKFSWKKWTMHTIILWLLEAFFCSSYNVDISEKVEIIGRSPQHVPFRTAIQRKDRLGLPKAGEELLDIRPNPFKKTGRLPDVQKTRPLILKKGVKVR